MLEGGGGLDLPHKSVGTEHGGELGFQDLDGDLAVVPQILGEIDRGHAALAELALDAVTVRKSCGQAGHSVAHVTLYDAGVELTRRVTPLNWRSDSCAHTGRQ